MPEALITAPMHGSTNGMAVLECRLEAFRHICRSACRAPAMQAAGARPLLGYVCNYFPEELAYAAGLLPVRILGRPKPLMRVERHVPSFGCSFVRTVLEMGLDGSLDTFWGFGFAGACDSMRVLADIWQTHFGHTHTAALSMPLAMHGASALAFTIAEYRRLLRWFEAHFGRRVTLEDLHTSITIYARCRRLLARLYRWRHEHPGLLKIGDVMSVVAAGMLMDKAVYNEMLAGLLERLDGLSDTNAAAKLRAKVVVAGNLCAFSDVLNAIETSQTVIVADDLCIGSRYFFSPSDEVPSAVTEQALVAWIADRYRQKRPCPAAYRHAYDRSAELKRLVQAGGAEGIIFLRLKSCDPQCFDLLGLQKVLAESGCPYLTLEYDLQTETFEQLKTRVEAFAEGLKDD
jgi:benzoyl-CoA reductase/2-hydroxyglutaryl-CoA dehydratase subunit BcrC/BadD/HgdB